MAHEYVLPELQNRGFLPYRQKWPLPVVKYILKVATIKRTINWLRDRLNPRTHNEIERAIRRLRLNLELTRVRQVRGKAESVHSRRQTR